MFTDFWACRVSSSRGSYQLAASSRLLPYWPGNRFLPACPPPHFQQHQRMKKTFYPTIIYLIKTEVISIQRAFNWYVDFLNLLYGEENMNSFDQRICMVKEGNRRVQRWIMLHNFFFKLSRVLRTRSAVQCKCSSTVSAQKIEPSLKFWRFFKFLQLCQILKGLSGEMQQGSKIGSNDPYWRTIWPLRFIF